MANPTGDDWHVMSYTPFTGGPEPVALEAVRAYTLLTQGPAALDAATATVEMRTDLVCEGMAALTRVRAADDGAFVYQGSHDLGTRWAYRGTYRGAPFHAEVLYAVLEVLKRGDVSLTEHQLRAVMATCVRHDLRADGSQPLGTTVARHLARLPLRRADVPLISGFTQVIWQMDRDRSSPEVEAMIGALDNWLLELESEDWPLAVNNWLATLPPASCAAWRALFGFATTNKGPRPARVWLEAAAPHLKAVGGDDALMLMMATFAPYLKLAYTPRSTDMAETLTLLNQSLHELSDDEAVASLNRLDEISEGGLAQGRFHRQGPLNFVADSVLKGLCWLLGATRHPNAIRTLRDMVRTCAKSTGVGLVAQGGMSGAVEGLRLHGTPEAVRALVHLRHRVTKASVINAIDAAIKRLSAEFGSYYEFVELADSDFGLNAAGISEDEVGSYTARITLNPIGKPTLLWIDANGAEHKSVPATLKKSESEDVKDGLKAIKARVKDLGEAIATRRGVLEAMMRIERSWPAPVWRERYLEHPLVGRLARPLIWTVTDGDRRVAVSCHEGRLVDAQGTEQPLPDSATVALWHPATAPEAEVRAWRRWLVEHEVTQPIKQAFREVYLLTDAERATADHSNRFAAHIIKQGQFLALAKARGWKATLIGTWSPDRSPHLLMHDVPVVAEFELAGVPGTEDIGYQYLSTDRVRFVTTGRSPQSVPLADVSPLVFSEVMRDVDLFVGVCSVATDPEWQPGGTHLNYRRDYDSGVLTASAEVRRAAIEALLPRLKIAKACTLGERHLEVQGKRFRYTIHLGSGNIQLADSGQYLCIVKAPTPAATKKLWLPFEGDERLAEILSKAFLLAADHLIKDPVILNQLPK